MPLILLAVAPVALAMVLLARRGERRGRRVVELLLGSLVFGLCGAMFFPFFGMAFPESTAMPAAPLSWAFVLAVCGGWLGGVAGLMVALLPDRRSAGALGLATSLPLILYVVGTAWTDPFPFKPHPPLWRLLAGRDAAPFFYVLLAIALWSLWLVRASEGTRARP